MSNVFVITDKKLTPQQHDVIEAFIEYQTATIEKDSKKLNKVMSENFTLTHMSGKIQTKDEFLDELLNGTLNYFKSSIINPEITFNDENQATIRADVEVNAKVYGINGTWTLNSTVMMIKEDDNWIIIDWKT